MIRSMSIGLVSVSLSIQAATTVVLRPSSSTANSGDAYTATGPTGGLQANNFGNAGALVISGTAAPNGQFQSVLKFDLATVTSTLNATFGAGAWVIDSLALELSAAVPNNASFNPNVAGQIAVDWLSTDSWTEGGITWNGMAALIAGGSESLGSLSYNGSSPSTVSYTLGSSAGFASDLAAGGIASLRLSAADTTVSMVLNSRNFGTVANRPALIITASAVPEPSRATLLLLGLLAVGRRRVKS
jgi:hypothetical protein